MPRALKTFSQLDPRNVELAKPKSNAFVLDLAGLELSDNELAQVRQQAVKAALSAAADLVGRTRPGNFMDAFGTFSTFSTFSTFGSGAASPFEGVLGRSLPREIESTINRIVNP